MSGNFDSFTATVCVVKDNCPKCRHALLNGSVDSAGKKVYEHKVKNTNKLVFLFTF